MLKNSDEQIHEILTRSVDKIYPSQEAFELLLKAEKPLRIYMGIDPTATYVHIGHATNYFILKRLHKLGHKIIVLIGDFTAMIGDPSDKSAARKRLTKQEVKNNLKTFKHQISKILDFKDKNNPIEIKFNSKWLSKLNFENLVELASNFTVQQMIERDNFQKRIKEHKPLFLNEFFYPLMQGYDSVALDADVEIGGTDQTFNMLAGRTLLKNYKNKEKIVVTTTLLENPVTGEKLMSKSLGTGIALDETPNNMFGKTMALPDEAIIQCFIDCTELSIEEIEDLKRRLGEGQNPRDLKILLAKEIVKIYHDEKKADLAEKYFIETFQKKIVPEEVPVVSASVGELLSDVLIRNNILSSKNEFKRLVIGKGVIFESGEPVIDQFQKIIKTTIFKIGKKRFVRIVVE